MPERIGDADMRFMAAAIRIGCGALGEAWPNPAVGAIIVKDNKVLASARTGRGGRPHAEQSALLTAGGDAAGATLYVSLEPCAHHGKTPPCADAIIAAGIARVVVGAADPDERVSGRGISALTTAGIRVEFVQRRMAEWAHQGHFSRMNRGRPSITLKLAVSSDGMIGRKGDGQLRITSERASRYVHALRSRFDSILVGRGTVETDDPQLTCRLPGLSQRSPARIVLDTNGSLDREAKVFRKDRSSRIFHVVSDLSAMPPGPENVEVLKVSGTAEAGLDLAEVFRKLSESGMTRIIVEGGARVVASLLETDFLDEIILFKGPTEIGSGGIPALSEGRLDQINTDERFRRVERRSFGPDGMVRYKRV